MTHNIYLYFYHGGRILCDPCSASDTDQETD